MDEISFRIRESPVGGSRIAYSYLAGLVVLSVVGFAFVVLSSVLDPFAGTGDLDQRALGLLIVGLICCAVLADALAARVFRLGWEWCSVLAAVHLTVPLWWSWLPIAVAWTPFLLAPLLAALATLSGPAKPPWRPWAIGAACGVGVTVALVAAFA